MRNYYKHLAPYIDGLTAMNLEVQADVAEYKSQISAPVFAKEFQTVGVLVPRRTGKTSYINNRANRDDLVIVPTHSIKHLYGRIQYEDNVEIIAVSELTPSRGRGLKEYRSVNRVYVDEPMLMTKGERDSIYQALGGQAKQFIFIGTP
jgi:hypothetical protein